MLKFCNVVEVNIKLPHIWHTNFHFFNRYGAYCLKFKNIIEHPKKYNQRNISINELASVHKGQNIEVIDHVYYNSMLELKLIQIINLFHT
jgi:hypothetical protein